MYFLIRYLIHEVQVEESTRILTLLSTANLRKSFPIQRNSGQYEIPSVVMV